MICLSFTSLSDLLSLPAPWTHCTLTPISSGQGRFWFEHLVNALKHYASRVCPWTHFRFSSLYLQLLAQRSHLLVPPPPHTPSLVPSLKRHSPLHPQEHTKGCFCTIMSLAIPDAQAPWLDKPLDIGGAPAMVDFAYADFMLTTINLTNTSYQLPMW